MWRLRPSTTASDERLNEERLREVIRKRLVELYLRLRERVWRARLPLFGPPDTVLRGELGVARRVAWTKQLDLAQVNATAHAQGATVNDVLLASVSGALRHHLRDGGEEPRAIRTLVPFNLRPLEEPITRELGNRFGLVYLTQPVSIFSYRGEVTIGLLVDVGLVPDPQTIMRHSEQELAALARLKPVAGTRTHRRARAAKGVPS